MLSNMSFHDCIVLLAPARNAIRRRQLRSILDVCHRRKVGPAVGFLRYFALCICGCIFLLLFSFLNFGGDLLMDIAIPIAFGLCGCFCFSVFSAMPSDLGYNTLVKKFFKYKCTPCTEHHKGLQQSIRTGLVEDHDKIADAIEKWASTELAHLSSVAEPAKSPLQR